MMCIYKIKIFVTLFTQLYDVYITQTEMFAAQARMF